MSSKMVDPDGASIESESVNSSNTIVMQRLQGLMSAYKDKFTNDELHTILQPISPAEVVCKLQLDLTAADTRASRKAEIANGIERYMSLLGIFGAMSPDLATLLWGGLDLVRTKSLLSKEVKEVMHAMIYEFCVLAPKLQTYDIIFDELRRPSAIHDALLSIYRSMLDFMYESLKWIKSSSSSKTGLLSPTPKTPSKEVSLCLKNLQKAKFALEAELPHASLALHKEWQLEIRTMLAKITVQPKGSLPCRVIPYPENPRFVGRDDILREMHSSLQPNTAGQSSFALYGIGGVGKTQLALKYIHDHLDVFPAIFWLTADSRTKLSQACVEAAKQLSIEPEDSQRDPEAVVQTFMAWLGETTASWLVVFDNVEDLRLLKQFWPPTSVGTIIVTSRDNSSTLVTKANCHVTSMTEKEGRDLFSSILESTHVGLTEEHEVWNINEVGKKLGYLPLAINQAASFIVERGCTVEDFLDIYNDSLKDEQSFEGIDIDSPNMFYDHSLATVWRISIKKLSAQSNVLLSILSCLDPDGIPETMIRQGAKVSEDFKFLASASSYTNSTKELLQNGLIWKRNQPPSSSKAGGKPIRSVALHRLVQETVFLQQDHEAQNRTFDQAVRVTLHAFPHPTRSNFRLMNHWPDCQQHLPHVLALNNRCKSTQGLVGTLDLAELFLYASWYLYERRAPEHAIPLLETAQSVCEREGGNADWFLRSRILSAFGCVLFECSRYLESERYFRQALTIRLQNVQPDDILLAHGYQDTALAMSGQGYYEQAIELQKQALEIVKRNTDDFTRRDMTFHVHHNMARTYEASGNAEAALKLHFHQGDEFGNGLRTEMSESGAVNLYAIGNCYLALGDQDRGIQYHSRALKIRLTLVGDQGFYYGISLHKTGCILRTNGQLREALNAFETAAGIFTHALDAQRELSRTLYHLAIVERYIGDKIEAEKHWKAAWELRAKITGEHQRDTKFDDEDLEGETANFDKLVIYIHA